MEWYVLAFISALILSFYNIIQKKILKKEHSLEFVAVTFLTVVVLMTPFISKVNFPVTLIEWLLVFFRSSVFAAAVLLMTKAMRHMEISSVTPLRNLSPFFLLFLSYFFLGERISSLQVIGVFLVMAGAYFLEIHDHYLDFFYHIKQFRNNKYFLYAIASAFFFSLSAIVSKTVLKTVDVFSYVYLTYFMTAAIYIAVIFIQHNGMSDILHGFKTGRWGILAAAILALITDATYFMAVAMPTAMVSLIIPIRRLSSLFSTAIGGSIFHEHYLFHKIVSTTIIVGGAALIVLG